MRRLTASIAATMVLLGMACGTSPRPADFVQRYVDLHRVADVDGMLALHTEDSEFVIPGQGPIKGQEALRDLFAWDEVLESRLVMEQISTDGDTIHIDRIVERNKWFEGLGIPEVRYQPGTRMVLRDGRILGTYVSGFDKETEMLVGERFPRLMHWLSTDRPDALQSLLPGGKFRYDAASARLWLQVLADWNQQEP